MLLIPSRRVWRAAVLGIAWVASLLCVVTLFTPSARADNPIVQTIYTADPAPLVYNGRVYLYTGHDEDNSTYCAAWLTRSPPARC